MFVWKALGKLILGDEEKRDLVSLPMGSLWRRRSERQHSQREIIERTLVYPRASLTLRRASEGTGMDGKGRATRRKGPSSPFSFELAVQERPETVDRGPSKGGAVTRGMLAFPLNEQLVFERTHGEKGNINFSWASPGEINVRYEFVYGGGEEEEAEDSGDGAGLKLDGTSVGSRARTSSAQESSPSSLVATVEMFHLMVAQCWWEQREQRSFGEASDEEIRALVIVHRPTVVVATTAEGPSMGPDGMEVKVSFTSEPASWYVFDGATGMFIPKQEGGRVRARILEGPSSSFLLQLVTGDEEGGEGKGPGQGLREVHRQIIDPDATLHTDRKNFSFIWCYFPPPPTPEDIKDDTGANDRGVAWTYSLRFADAPSVMALSNGIGQAIYEILNQAKVAEEDRDYLLGSLCATTMAEGEGSAVDDDGNSIYSDDTAATITTSAASDRSEGTTSDGESEEEEEEGARSHWTCRPKKASTTAKNQHLVVGYKHDRSFVSRGDALSIFKHTDDDQLELLTDIDRVRTSDGRRLLTCPRQLMLHEEDRSLLLVDAQEPGTIHRLDVEYGRVVEEWQATKSYEEGDPSSTSLAAILPSSKYAQLTGEPTLIGLTDRSLFRLDPRLPGPVKRVQAESKEYVLKNGFSCGATTGAGELAVGSARGEIRLFDRLDRRAKTLLPGFGDPILALDSTESGRWLVATCKTYLLLICTEHADQEGLLGFHRSLGAKKPTPRRLQLRPEHVAYLGGPVSFTPARFSTGQSEERSIITSTGPYVITWNLRRVKAGHLYDYQIRKYEDTVVADNFRYGQDRSIVVTLPHHVTMLSKRSLSTPSATLMRGRRRGAGGKRGNTNSSLPISIEDLNISSGDQ